jgi:hypothetical protein
MSTRFQDAWMQVATRLGLHVDCPFSVTVGSDRVTVPVRLREFGAAKGMLLVTEYSTIRPYAEALVDLGFGYSCLSESVVSSDSIVDVLNDWGWAGAGEQPDWLSKGAP